MKKSSSTKTSGDQAVTDSVEAPFFAEFLKDLVARFDPQFRHTYVNKAVEHATGRPASDFIGKTNQDLGMPANLVKQWNDQLSGVFSSGSSSETHFAFPSPTGLRHFISRLTPEFGLEGRVRSVVSVAQDVTEMTVMHEKVQCLESLLKQADFNQHKNCSAMSVEMAAEYYKAIVESSDDAIISKTLDGVITSWNPAAQVIFGYSCEEMLGRSLLGLLPPEKSNEESFILERIQAGETVDHFETTRIHKDGRRIHVSVTTSPIRDRSGKIIGASKIARDITAQKIAERQLKLTASVFTSTSEGILIADRKGFIVDINDSFTRITGYSKDDVVGQDARVFRSSSQGPEVFRFMRTALRHLGEWRGEMWSRRKDGQSYSVILTVSAVRSADGNVQNYVALFSDITPLKLQQEKLEHSAQYDPLTDLPNRLLLSDRLHQAMALCQRQNQNLAVLYLDLDGFKYINDHYGHDVGDELLISVSNRMKLVLRDVDTLARIGGDEFVAVLVNIGSTQDCIQLVARVLDACAETVRIQGRELKVTASIGVTIYPQDDAEADQLMRHADQAMFEAKQNGKNRIFMFDSALDAEVKTRGLQQECIAQALLRQEFVLYYQPKVNMRTGALVGVEALIRWVHPERGLLAPGAFLPVIEKHPLNEIVGSWVIETALKQLTEWKLLGLTLPVSVNISARQFQQESFASQLSQALANHPEIDANCLELEILETSALEDIGSVTKIMADCHRLGVLFAIDDFGTGYSSLTYLRRLPVETLKIDQSFVRDMLDDPDDLAIVTGVIGLASAFHKHVIAEGVESVESGKKLIELGCDLAQGYAIARPMSGSQIPEWSVTWQPPKAWTRAC
ncbi:MAG: EAL domain-containing protein [Rhodoferax sp.]|uniref:sensor domain-containing protein n=1 Tax=Rhodoferax sp. TaxID=50421 RepID=UPI002636BE1E|nr:EAL domain-containing protein [Rhodoferax sp.]MDD2879919.1 EAL domain-containing protein [Rhodoferax sp.]